MATNPMKRREHNAFLIGLIIGLILVIVVGFIMHAKNSSIQKKYDEYVEAQEEKQMKVVVATQPIQSGNIITEDDVEIATVMVGMSKKDCYVKVSDLLEEDDEENGDTFNLEMSSKFDIPKGTIITKDMVQEDSDKIQDDTRLREYNSIVLPSDLKQGDIIDIRLSFSSGQDYIVLSKKKVLKTDETTVWFNMSEAEMLILNSAMVEAWTIQGSKLYAVKYAEAGIQKSAIVTYQPRAEVTTLIESNPNIVDDAATALANEWENANAASFRETYIDAQMQQYVDDIDSAAESGWTEETSNIRAHRSEYIESLGED